MRKLGREPTAETVARIGAGAPTGYRMLYTPPPANLDSLFRFSAPSTANAVSAATNTAGGGVLMDLLTRRDEHGASALTSTDPLVRLKFCF